LKNFQGKFFRRKEWFCQLHSRRLIHFGHFYWLGPPQRKVSAKAMGPQPKIILPSQIGIGCSLPIIYVMGSVFSGRNYNWRVKFCYAYSFVLKEEIESIELSRFLF